MRRTLLALSIAALLAGCGSDDDDDRPIVDGGGGGNPPVAEAIEITGAALAPGGMLSQVQPYSSFQVVMNFLITPAAAAITGLSPVGGATVELYRVNNAGERAGEVLDSTTTNDDGEYTLELPEGEELGGDLIVAITAGDTTIRAQAIAEQVDVTPVSEFVLKKLITGGAKLNEVTPDALVDLTTTIEALDLQATGNIEDLLADLETAAGPLVEESIEVIVAQPGSGSSVAGNYRNVAFQWGLEAGAPWGDSYLIDTWVTDITVAAGASSGTVTFEVGHEVSDGVSLSFGGYQLYPDQDIEDVDDTITLNFAGGIASFNQPEERDFENDDFAYYTAAKVYKFRQVPGRDFFILEANDSATVHENIDANGDGAGETLGAEILGTEAFRGIEFLMKKPSAANNASMQGKFGRVYIGTSVFEGGWIEIESEQNVLEFNGNGTLAVSAADQYVITMDTQSGATDFDVCIHSEGDADCPEAEAITYTLGANGAFTEMGGASNPQIYVNSDFNLLVGSEHETIDEDGRPGVEEYGHSVTLAVKLPTGTPTVGEKVYRVLQVENELTDTISFNMIRPSTTLTMAGQTVASMNVTSTEVELFRGEPLLNVESNAGHIVDVAVSHGANGAVTFTVDDDGDIFVMEGFFNEDASFAVLQTRYTGDDDSGPTALGVAVLVEVAQ